MEQNFNPYTNPTGEGTPPPRRIITKPNYFELAAFAFAIASIISCTVLYTAYFFGGLAILFALLSRGAQMSFSQRAKKALIIAIGAIILSTIIFIASFIYLYQEYGSLEGILRAGSEMIGIDFEKEFGSLFQ